MSEDVQQLNQYFVQISENKAFASLEREPPARAIVNGEKTKAQPLYINTEKMCIHGHIE